MSKCGLQTSKSEKAIIDDFPQISAAVINPDCPSLEILKRIPRCARVTIATKLAAILDDITRTNSDELWERLFLFVSRCLVVPKRRGHRRNLVSQIIKAALDNNSFSADVNFIRAKPKPARVACKLEEGDFLGAVRIAASNDCFAMIDNKTFDKLQQKHPPAHPYSSIPPTIDMTASLHFSSADVMKAIFSFPAGSAAGHDGICPQHLKDLVSKSVGDPGSILISSLTKFVNLVASGYVSPAARPFLLVPSSSV